MSETIKLDTLFQDKIPEVDVITTLKHINLDDTTSTMDLIDKEEDEGNENVSFCHSSSLSCTSFNFINSIIGSGVIGMPLAFKEAGIGMTFILLLLVASLTDYSILTLISSANAVGVTTYQDLVHVSLGNFGYILLIIVQFLYPFISLVSYNVIVGDTITKVLTRVLGVTSNSIFANRNYIIFFCATLVMLPLSLLRNISKLAKTSMISVVILISIMVVMIIKLVELRPIVPQKDDSWSFVKSFPGSLNSFSIMAFGFMCHHNTFLIYHSMREVNYKNWKKVTHSSVSVSVIFSAVFGLIGFLTFHSFTEGDIFENYCQDDSLINVVRILYALIIMFTYPLECFVCRDVIENTFFRKYKDNRLSHILITMFVVFITILLSLMTDCLGIVLELNGSIIATLLAYVMPMLCFISINYKHKKFWLLIIPVLVCIIGISVAIYGFGSAIYRLLFSGYDCSHGREPLYCLDRIYKYTVNSTDNSTTNIYANISFTTQSTTSIITSL